MGKPKQPPCPECDRALGLREQNQTIGQFIDWLNEHGMCIASTRGDGYWPVNHSIEKLIADYQGIDLKKMEKEKRKLLEWVRKQHA